MDGHSEGSPPPARQRRPRRPRSASASPHTLENVLRKHRQQDESRPDQLSEMINLRQHGGGAVQKGDVDNDAGMPLGDPSDRDIVPGHSENDVTVRSQVLHGSESLTNAEIGHLQFLQQLLYRLQQEQQQHQHQHQHQQQQQLLGLLLHMLLGQLSPQTAAPVQTAPVPTLAQQAMEYLGTLFATWPSVSLPDYSLPPTSSAILDLLKSLPSPLRSRFRCLSQPAVDMYSKLGIDPNQFPLNCPDAQDLLKLTISSHFTVHITRKFDNFGYKCVISYPTMDQNRKPITAKFRSFGATADDAKNKALAQALAPLTDAKPMELQPLVYVSPPALSSAKVHSLTNLINKHTSMKGMRAEVTLTPDQHEKMATLRFGHEIIATNRHANEVLAADSLCQKVWDTLSAPLPLGFLSKMRRRTPCRLWRQAAQFARAAARAPVCVLACSPPSLLVKRLVFVLRNSGVQVTFPRFNGSNLFESAAADAKLTRRVLKHATTAAHVVVVADNRAEDLQLFASQRFEGISQAQATISILLDELEFDSEDMFSDVISPDGQTATAVAVWKVLIRCSLQTKQELNDVKRLLHDFDSQLLARECLEAGTVQSTRVKLSVIGHAAAGKSTVVKMLQTQSASPLDAHKPTEQVTLSSFPIGDITYIVQDFPGQQEFYGTNVSFMACERALFLLVIDLALQEDELESQLMGWLSSLSLMVSSQSLGFETKPPKVILVGTHRDLLTPEASASKAGCSIAEVAELFSASVEVSSSMHAIACQEQKDAATLCTVVARAGYALCEHSRVPRSIATVQKQLAQFKEQKWVSLGVFREWLTMWLRNSAPLPAATDTRAVVPPLLQEQKRSPADDVADDAPFTEDSASASTMTSVSAAETELPAVSDEKGTESASSQLADLLDEDAADEEEEDIFEMSRAQSIESILETQGDVLRLSVANTSTLIVIDPQWFAKVVSVAVQPRSSWLRGLTTRNGVVDRAMLEQGLTKVDLLDKLAKPPSSEYAELTVMQCLFTLLQLTQVCYPLRANAAAPAATDKFLIPSRVEKAHLSVAQLQRALKSPVAVRLSCPGDCVLPPGLFALLMCALRPPINYADEAMMFAMREFVVLDKERKVFTVVAVQDKFIDVIASSADRTALLQQMHVLLSELHNIKNLSRWSGLQWAQEWLCSDCVSRWKIKIPSAEEREASLGFKRTDPCKCTPFELSATGGALQPPGDPCVSSDDCDEKRDAPILHVVVQAAKAVRACTREELLDRIDLASVLSATMDSFLSRLLTHFPRDPVLGSVVDDLRTKAHSAYWRKICVKRWLQTNFDQTLPASIIQAWCAAVTETSAADYQRPQYWQPPKHPIPAAASTVLIDN